MFKRVFWLGVGAATGSAATVWGQRKVKQQVEAIQSKATPSHVVDVAKTKATDLKDRVVTAVNEGIAEGRQTEADLRAGLPRSFAGSAAATTASAADNAAALANSVSNFAASAADRFDAKAADTKTADVEGDTEATRGPARRSRNPDRRRKQAR